MTFYEVLIKIHENNSLTFVRNFDTSYQNFDRNGVYTVNNQRYIYYQEQWYKFSDDNVVQCPVYALVDYIYELMKGEY